MITFKTYLTEARMAPLYHATSVKNINSILANGIQPRTQHNNIKLLKQPANTAWDSIQLSSGISTTRILNLAKQFGSSIFVFDQQKLAQKYQIKPIQYFTNIVNNRFTGSSRSVDQNNAFNEFEEFIVTNKPVPMKYVSKILVSKTAALNDGTISDLNKSGIPWEWFTR